MRRKNLGKIRVAFFAGRGWVASVMLPGKKKRHYDHHEKAGKTEKEAIDRLTAYLSSQGLSFIEKPAQLHLDWESQQCEKPLDSPIASIPEYDIDPEGRIFFPSEV